jgi:flagella basal body P-ring formation protein FlgA
MKWGSENVVSRVNIPVFSDLSSEEGAPTALIQGKETYLSNARSIKRGHRIVK